MDILPIFNTAIEVKPLRTPSVSIEYTAVPASDFGMDVRNAEGAFDHSVMADHWNKLAVDGWQYHDVISAAEGLTVLSVVVLQRRR